MSTVLYISVPLMLLLFFTAAVLLTLLTVTLLSQVVVRLIHHKHRYRRSDASLRKMIGPDSVLPLVWYTKAIRGLEAHPQRKQEVVGIVDRQFS